MKFLEAIWNWFTGNARKEPSPPKPYEPPIQPPACIEDEICNGHNDDFDNPQSPVSDWTPINYRSEYVELWLTMKYPVLRSGSNGSQEASTIDWSVNFVKRHELRYRKAAEKVYRVLGSRVPWQLIAAIHLREGGGYSDPFDRNFMNGQPLSQRTTIVPKGFGPWSGPEAWEDSVVDGFRIKSRPDFWTIANTLHFAHRYNGLGYMKHREVVGHSPYLFAFTNHYVRGLYYADGKFSSSRIAKGVGVALILKELNFRGEE